MPLIEAARAALAASIEPKSTVSNALCDAKHIRVAKACHKVIAALTLDRDVRQSHRLREPQSLKLARREAKAPADLDRCDPVRDSTSPILNEDI
jgi:hypothetical protein